MCVATDIVVLGWGMSSHEKWALGKSAGHDEGPGECQTCPDGTPDTSWTVKITQGSDQAPSSPSAPKMHPKRECVPPWVAPLHTNSWLSQIHDKQTWSMERQAETLGCWSWGLQNLQYYFLKDPISPGFCLILPSDWYLNFSGLQNIVLSLRRTVLLLWSLRLLQEDLLRYKDFI